MRTTPPFYSLCSVMVLLLCCSGIIRHDVDELKHRKLAAEPQFNCVGRLYRDDTASIGSCVLIGEKYLLSAAHCFIEPIKSLRADTFYENKNRIIVFEKDSKIAVTNANRISVLFNDKKFRIKNITLFPEDLKNRLYKNGDIVLLELEQPVLSISPAIINTELDELNAEVVGVGYGAFGIANKPSSVNKSTIKIAGENVVDSLGGFVYNQQHTLLFCDFDHPNRKELNRMGSSEPKPLEYICAGGDSGGGLFRKKNNTWELVGICSGADVDTKHLIKDGYYGSTMSWTRVSAFTKWIKEHTK